MNKSLTRSPLRSEGGSILLYVLLALMVFIVIASVGTNLTTHSAIATKRRDMERAYQFASGGAAIACSDLNRAFATSPKNIGNALVNDSSFPYTYSAGLSTGSESCYTRTISAPFVGQAVSAQIWLSLTNPTSVRVVASATTNGATQEVTAAVSVAFGFGAAITSTNQGNSSNGTSKSIGQQGNVVINAKNANSTYVDGEIIANGSVNHTAAFVPESDQISENLYSTEDQIPDYTNPGSPDQLFDFNRFIAVANVKGTHFANTAAFKAAVAADSDHTLEGVIVVDIENKASDWTSSDYPYGINIIGTLILNFDSSAWGPTDKLQIKAALNINAADITGLVPGDADTYTTGYPPAYSSSAYDPATADITGAGYINFTATDDLPALMYNTAIADFHGNTNVCGVVYSPSFCEIENKSSGQVQYFRGSVIVGGGVYFENTNNAISIISFDPECVTNLAVDGAKGTVVKVVHRE